MKTESITIGGAELQIAPLKSIEVAEFFDEKVETQVQIVTKSLRNIARSLKNAKSPFVEGLDEVAVMAKINESAETWLEVDTAFGVVLDTSALRKKTEGEATAAASISSESSAAS